MHSSEDEYWDRRLRPRFLNRRKELGGQGMETKT